MSKLYKSAFENAYSRCVAHSVIMRVYVDGTPIDIPATSVTHLYTDGMYSLTAVFDVPSDGRLDKITYTCTSGSEVPLMLEISYGNMPVSSGAYVLYVTSIISDATLNITFN